MNGDKEAIKKSFNENKQKDKETFEIINTWKDNQLHLALHMADHYTTWSSSYDPNLEFDEVGIISFVLQHEPFI